MKCIKRWYRIEFGEDVLWLYYCTFEAEHATTSDPNYASNDLVVSNFPLGSQELHTTYLRTRG